MSGHLDPVLLIESDARCSLRGCPFPATWTVHDQWGSQPVCSQHKDSVTVRFAEPQKLVSGRHLFDQEIATLRFPSSLDRHNDAVSIVGRDFFTDIESKHTWMPKTLHPHVFYLCECGFATRRIARIIGFHRMQIRRALSLWYPGDLASIKCECGLPRCHQGWCSVRFRASEVRQETIRLMHLKRKVQAMQLRGASIDEARLASAATKDGRVSQAVPISDSELFAECVRFVEMDARKRDKWRNQDTGVQRNKYLRKSRGGVHRWDL